LITKLTKEQLELIPVVRQEWFDRIFKNRIEIDRQEVTELIRWLYAFAGIKNKRPFVIFLDSPLACQYAANMINNQVRNQVRDQVRDQVWDQVRNQISGKVRDQISGKVWDQISGQVSNQVRDKVLNQVRDQVRGQILGKVWDQIWGQISNQVWDQISGKVRDQVRGQIRDQISGKVRDQISGKVWDQIWGQVSNQVRDKISGQILDQELLYFGISYYGDVSDYGWISFYDYFERIGLDYKNDNYNKLKKLITSGIFSFIPLDDFCIICPLPDKILRLDEKLHSDTQSAISWKDGYELYFLYGICFEKEIWGKIISRDITAKEILKFENIEQRMAALKFYGADNLLSELNAKLIDDTAGYELYELDKIFSQTAYFLKYSCPSTGRVYVSGIDPEVGKLGDAMAACAWKFGVEKNQYKLAAES